MEIVSANGLAEEGKKAYQAGEYTTAGRAFQAAAQAYRHQGDECMAAEMLNNSSVAYLLANEPHLAYQTVKDTPEVFQSAGDVRRAGLAFGNLGAALEALHQHPAAIQAYLQSSDLLEQCGELEQRAQVMQSLSALQLKSGRQFEALASMQSGLQGIRRPNPIQILLKKLLGVPFKLLLKK